MADVIQVDELAAMITRELENYCDEIQDSTDVAADKATKQLVVDIREDSPADKGDYKKGWTRKKLKHSRVVYNKTYWWLTNLLEHGHNKRNGGRVAAKPHIYKNSKRATEEFEDMCVAIVAEGVRFK